MVEIYLGQIMQIMFCEFSKIQVTSVLVLLVLELNYTLALVQEQR